MRKIKRKNINDIFASGGIIGTGNAGSNFWSNDDAGSDKVIPSVRPKNANLKGLGLDGGIDKTKESNGSTTSDIVSGIAGGATGLLSNIKIEGGGYKGGKETSTGSDALKGVVEGWNQGSAVGGWLGGILYSSFLGSHKLFKGLEETKRIKKETLSQQESTQKQYARNDLMSNPDKYGSTYMEDGGMTGEPMMMESEEPAAQQAPAKKMINVERGEIMVNPMDMAITQKFLNPNRFSSHQKKESKEPIGNFVVLPEGHVIIPKKYATRYEKGDILTRKSIVMQLLSDQKEDPYHNVRDENKPEGAEQFEDGGRIPGRNDKYMTQRIGNNYGVGYSGVAGINNPTRLQVLKAMADYSQNNMSDQSDTPSNVYRPEFEHFSINMPTETVPVAAKGMYTGGPDPIPVKSKKKSVKIFHT
jgi:hypothetical protein